MSSFCSSYPPVFLIVTDHKGKSKGKRKVKLSLCLTKHHAMKVYWESGGVAPLILSPRQ
jgi:hypothetical protein